MAEATENLNECVEGGDGIFVIRGGENCRSWNNIQYRAGLSAKNTPARKLSMNVATIPPGGVAYAHIHVDFDVMLYILHGRVRQECMTLIPVEEVEASVRTVLAQAAASLQVSG